MKTLVNTNNIESNNGMSQVIIDMRPQVKHQDGHGREKVADVYFRTQVRAYSRQVYGDYSQEAHEAAEKATAAYYSEVVELLKGEGWTLLNDYAHWHTCPELTKGAQYLYVHPDSISGEVNPADIDALEAKFKALTACEYRGTDNYGDIILTHSEADERMLYRETYTEGIADTIKECTTTKRSNLYKDRGDALGCIRNRIAIQNKRTDLTGHGTGYYRERKAVAGFVQEEYDRLLQAGYIKEATGQNGRTLCRWINKKEEKELNKARREAEKAEKAAATTLEPASEITEAEEQWRPTTAKDYREGNKFEDEINVGDRVYSCNYETMGTVVGRYWWNGDNCYRVRMDRECEGGFGRKFIVTSFHRDGLTKNIGKDGREIIGNAEYYRETLFASWWGFNGEPRTFSFDGQKIDIYKKDGQEWEVVSHHQNGEPTRDTMTTGEVCEWLSRLYSKSQEPLRPAVIEPITEADKSPSWETDLTEDDFRKLTLQHEVADEDRDIMGRRFRHAIGNKGEWLEEIFISDYAGNERHALVYSYEEFMDEVRCKVRSLEYLRQFYTEDRGWQPVSA